MVAGGSLTASDPSCIPCDPSPRQRGAGCFLQQDRSLSGIRPRCPLIVSPLSLQMKRALVLGASALLILALNQNAIREVGQCWWWGWAGIVPRSRLRFPPAGRVPAARQARHCHPVLGQRHQAAGSAAAVRAEVWEGLHPAWSLFVTALFLPCPPPGCDTQGPSQGSLTQPIMFAGAVLRRAEASWG